MYSRSKVFPKPLRDITKWTIKVYHKSSRFYINKEYGFFFFSFFFLCNHVVWALEWVIHEEQCYYNAITTIFFLVLNIYSMLYSCCTMCLEYHIVTAQCKWSSQYTGVTLWRWCLIGTIYQHCFGQSWQVHAFLPDSH